MNLVERMSPRNAEPRQPFFLLAEVETPRVGEYYKQKPTGDGIWFPCLLSDIAENPSQDPYIFLPVRAGLLIFCSVSAPSPFPHRSRLIFAGVCPYNLDPGLLTCPLVSAKHIWLGGLAQTLNPQPPSRALVIDGQERLPDALFHPRPKAFVVRITQLNSLCSSSFWVALRCHPIPMVRPFYHVTPAGVKPRRASSPSRRGQVPAGTLFA